MYAYEDGDHIMVAMSTGLIQDATHVTMIVPGMGTTANDIVSYTNAATGLQERQHLISGLPPSQLAVVAWLDYVPPNSADVIGVAHGELARAGADRLADSIQGIHTIKGWAEESPNLSIVAHSYGTDVAAIALSKPGVGAGNVVLLGSAGIENNITRANTLHVPEGQVFASEGNNDGWATVGQQMSGRQDPTAPIFGAHDLSSEAETAKGQHLHAVTQHGPLAYGPGHLNSYSYLDNNTTAQYNTATATMGHGAALPMAAYTPQDRVVIAGEKNTANALNSGV
jgi:pimeloyl-ACP methyl ester carboxylesterase